MREDEMDEDMECIEDHSGDCKGPVEFRMSLSGTGVAMPRCDHHWDLRLQEQDRINQTYGPDSDVAPSWFHRSWGGANEYGEHWDSDY